MKFSPGAAPIPCLAPLSWGWGGRKTTVHKDGQVTAAVRGNSLDVEWCATLVASGVVSGCSDVGGRNLGRQPGALLSWGCSHGWGKRISRWSWSHMQQTMESPNCSRTPGQFWVWTPALRKCERVQRRAEAERHLEIAWTLSVLLCPQTDPLAEKSSLTGLRCLITISVKSLANH